MKKTYKAPEIHCQSCAGLIKDTLDDVPGVQSVDVDVTEKTVTIEFADEGSEPKALQLLGEEGYTTTPV